MANYATTTKIIKGTVTATEASDTSGTVSAAVNDYIQDLDSTGTPIISISTAMDGGHTLIVTIVSGDNPYYAGQHVAD